MPAISPSPAALDKPSVPAVIDLSNLSPDLERNHGYADYFKALRERIRWYAQRNYPRGSRGGEVYLSFIVSAGGHLQGASVEADRSATEVTLHRASLQSVQQAAPFPPFPPTFRQPQITFRIVIDYESGP